MLIIGATIFFSKTYILFLNGYNLFGFLIGFGLAYYNKGLTIFIVKSLCEEAVIHLFYMSYLMKNHFN